MNILITSIGNKTNLIKYFRRALFKEGGGRIIGIDTDSRNNGQLYVDKFLVCPGIEEDGYGYWLKTCVQELKVSLIIPSRDGDLVKLSTLKQELADNYDCHVMVNDKSVLEVCLDKYRFYQWCKKHAYPTAKLYDPGEVTETVLPVFVKPRKGSGSIGCTVVSSIGEWEKWNSCHPLANYVVQEYLDCVEYSVDVFCLNNGEVISIVPRQRLCTQGGESVRAKIYLHHEIIKTTRKLASDLQLVGQNTIQYFANDDSFFVSEVNPRFGGGFTLSVEAGADSPRFLLREIMGKEVSFSPVHLDITLTMARIQKDIFISNREKEYTDFSGTVNRSMASKIYCFDLDGTICSEECAYEEARPMPLILKKLNMLYDLGNTIILCTARGAASGTDWRELVENQLKLWGVKYHLLVMNKPYADVYIDNKALDVLDFV